MTNREAIEHLKIWVSNYKKILGREEYETCSDIVSLELAIAALEKQEPMRPESKWTEDSTSPFIAKHRAGRCPVCGQGTRDYMKFCHHCGQALNWEEDAE